MHAPLLCVRGMGKPLLTAAIALTGAVLMLATSEPFYPIREWLLWQYLALIGLSGYALVASLSLGDWLLRRIYRFNLPTHERLTFALALGLTGFEVGMFLIGALGGYGTTTFILYPLGLVLLGIQQWRNYQRRLMRLLKQGQRLRASRLLFVLFGCLALGLIYFSIMSPSNVQFDARWKHMALAEDYVAHGGIRRMPEGWVFAARPHLTSYLYVWAFSLPFGSLFHRMELCAHLEYFVFLLTTFFGIPAVLRRMVPETDPRVAWVARFLFPGILLYDSSLTAGADHFGAILAPAIALATLHAYRRLDRHWVLLLTTLLSGAVMVKETVAIMLVPLPLAVLLLRPVWLTTRSANWYATLRPILFTLGAALSLGLLLTTPFWLKNWVWYRNPVYPSLSGLFPSTPWSEIAAYRFGIEYSETNMWSPDKNLLGFLESLRALVDFSFLPNDWSRFHGNRPVFGSLFTLLAPLLFFLRGTKRVWALVAWIHVALFTWYWVHHQDRYLQAILPLMAASTAAILILVFRQLRQTVRGLVVGLVAIQLALAADVYFIATHAMTGSAVKRTVELLGMGYQGKYDERFTIEQKYVALATAIPKGKRILFHDMQSHLGSEHEGVRDVALWQSGLNYSQAKHPTDIHRWLNDMGVSHIVLNAGRSTGMDRLASDLIFFDFVYRRTKRLRNVEGMHVFQLTNAATNVPFRDRAVVVNCLSGTTYELHQLAALARPGIGPLSEYYATPLAVARNATTALPLYDQADFAVVSAKCEVPPGLSVQFRKIAERPKRGSVPACTLYIRRADSSGSDAEKDS